MHFFFGRQCFYGVFIKLGNGFGRGALMRFVHQIVFQQQFVAHMCQPLLERGRISNFGFQRSLGTNFEINQIADEGFLILRFGPSAQILGSLGQILFTNGFAVHFNQNTVRIGGRLLRKSRRCHKNDRHDKRG